MTCSPHSYTDLISRLRNVADVMQATTYYYQYCATILEAVQALENAPSGPGGEPDGYAVLFMPGTEHFCYVGIWAKREHAELIMSKTRGGDQRIEPMYFSSTFATGAL